MKKLSSELLKTTSELYAIQAQIKEYDAYWLDSNVKVLRDERGRFVSRQKANLDKIVEEAKILDKATQETLSPEGLINNFQKITSLNQNINKKIKNIVKGFDDANIGEKLQIIKNLYGLQAEQIVDSTLKGLNQAKKEAKKTINDTYKKLEGNIQNIAGKDVENSIQDFFIKHKLLKKRNIGEEIADVGNIKEAQHLINKYLGELTSSMAVASLATKMSMPSTIAAGLLFTAPELLVAFGVGATITEILGVAGVGIAEAAITDMAGGTLADLSRKFGDTEDSATLAGIRLGGSLLVSVAVAGKVGAWKQSFINQAKRRKTMDKGLTTAIENTLSNNEKQLNKNAHNALNKLETTLAKTKLEKNLNKKNNIRYIESLLIHKYKIHDIPSLESFLERKLTSTERKMAKKAFNEFKKSQKSSKASFLKN